MSLVIVAYRQEYEKRCPRGCCHEGNGPSKFDIQIVEDAEKASDWIAKHIHEDTEAEYAHLVFRNWEDIEEAAFYHTPNLRQGEKSIEMYGPYDDPEDEAEREKMRDHIRRLVADKLGKFSEEAKLREEEKKQQEAAKRLAQDKDRRLAQFNELKKEFDQTPNK